MAKKSTNTKRSKGTIKRKLLKNKRRLKRILRKAQRR